MTESTLLTYRDLILRLVPRWLRRGSIGPGRAGKILYAIGAQLDAMSDALVAGVKRRFPGYEGEYDSLPLIGTERRIARGPFETDAGYAARLLTWQQDHRDKGNPYPMLKQLYGFWGGAFTIALVYRTGKRFTLNTNGTIVRDYIGGWSTPNDYDTLGRPLCKWKLFFYWPVAIGNDGLWGSVGSSGDMHWGDGGIWGVNLTPTEVRNILLVPTEWNTAHALGSVTLLPPAIQGDTSHWQDEGLVCLGVY